MSDYQFFERDGVRLRYRWDGEGPILTLVHGVGGAADSWDFTVQHLMKHYRILRLDQRGHGGSDKVPGPYKIWDFVEDLKALLDHVGLKKTRLAGFSLGGLVVQGFALSHPQYIERLAILAAVAGRTQEERDRVMGRLEILRSLGPVGHFEASLDRWFTPEFREKHPELIAIRRHHATRMDPECYVNAYRVLAETDLADRLHEIKVPTLVATGEFDVGSNVRMSKLMHERIQGSKFEVYPGRRHSMMIEAPHELAASIHNFMKD
jgi:(E)-2-((N-methylformamido)methylene)succinate hydrolase